MGRCVGGSQTLSKMVSRFPGSYPKSIVSGRGARVEDVTGKQYIDWVAALGALSLGYLNYDVDRAVHAQVNKGPIFSLPDVELEERVAAQLCDLIPCAEAVRFVKTGSEATEAAIRVARAHTGREIVLSAGYHGWHSMWAAEREYCPGVPLAMKGLVKTFCYNDTNSLEQAIDDIPQYSVGQVAAIILEPTLYEVPAPGFLQGVREIATRLGAVLIFDEMVTGFRWHAGGYQALCGVTPDLATFGKGMGNGYPIAALVGRADIMRRAMLVSGTFGGDCIGLAAASATMEVYTTTPRGMRHDVEQDGVTAHMHHIGRQLMGEYNSLARSIGAPTRMEGQPPHPRIVWDEVDESITPGTWDGRGAPPPSTRKNRHRASLFFQETARRGVLFHPDGLNIMLVHGQAEVDQTLEACQSAMVIVEDAIRHGDVRARIEGDPISPEPPWRTAA